MRGLKSKDLVAIMDFIYLGEANIYQEDLDGFLVLAEELQLKGLTGSAEEDLMDEKTEIYQQMAKPKLIQKTVQNAEPKLIPKEEYFTTEKTNNAENRKNKSIIPVNTGKIILDSNYDDIQNQIATMMERTTDGDYKWKCTVCGKATKDKQDIKRHIESHIEGLSYPCNQCGKVSRSSNALQVHLSKFHKL